MPRTCAGCREEADRDDLVRLVVHPVSGELVVDYSAKLPGRGAWVHARRACVEHVERKPGSLQRGLKTRPDATGLGDKLRAAVLRALEDGLSQAAAAGALVGGHERLVKALLGGGVDIVVVASDASPRTIGDLQAKADEDVRFVTVPIGREALGMRVGKGARAALGVTGSRAASHLRRQLDRLEALG